MRTHSVEPDGPISKVEILPGSNQKIRIYWRAASSCYWAETRRAGAKDRWSTKQKSYSRALLVAATDIGKRGKSKKSSATNDSFRSVARRVIENLSADSAYLSSRSEPASGGPRRTKRTAHDYILALERWFIPHFGPIRMKDIGPVQIAEFETWRLGEFERAHSRRPSKSVLSNHAAAAKLVWLQAQREELVPWGLVPPISRSGRAAVVGQPFLPDEVREIRLRIERLLEHYSKNNPITFEILLHLDLLICLTLATGLRPGSEARSITWGGFHYIETDGGPVMHVQINHGKRGNRIPAVDADWLPAINAPLLNFIDDEKSIVLPLSSTHELTSQPIFLRTDGKITRQDVLDKIFARILRPEPWNLEWIVSPRTRSDLRYHPHQLTQSQRTGGQATQPTTRTIYSLRHTYATEQINRRNRPRPDQLAFQMGTSTSMIELHYGKVYRARLSHKIATPMNSPLKLEELISKATAR
jgi:integrase